MLVRRALASMLTFDRLPFRLAYLGDDGLELRFGGNEPRDGVFLRLAAQARVEWVRPDGGALCCIRLRTDVFDDAAVVRFRDLMPEYEVQLAGGDWFGADARMFRLGFGYLPLPEFEIALSALSRALDAAQTAA